MLRMIICAVAVIAVVQLGFNLGAFAQTDCEGEVGAAYGLCNAYCEAMNCDSDYPRASSTACGKVLTKYNEIAGSVPPCVAAAPAACPCNFRVDFWADAGWTLNVGRINNCVITPEVPPFTRAFPPQGNLQSNLIGNEGPAAVLTYGISSGDGSEGNPWVGGCSTHISKRGLTFYTDPVGGDMLIDELEACRADMEALIAELELICPQ